MMQLFTLDWFGVFSVTWWPCAVVAFSAGCVVLVRWFAYTKSGVAPAKTYKELFAHFSAFFRTDRHGFWSTRKVAALALGAGLLSMLSGEGGNILHNEPCQRACKAADWSNGRYRKNPHDVTDPSPYACWCFRGKDWSEAPIAEDDL
jgi:hypothetical protein